MRYVALLSGGKDSCFNLLHCSKNGHQLVAAASLGPGPGKDEIDSYLYQTVGQDAIQLVADALEVPLLRKVITGTAVQQGSEYGSRSRLDPWGVHGDETEDLFELLLDVKNSFPEVEGVSVGAILSNYQRVRVEHVCQRLSLTPLCYLWQRDQSELLSEMIESGIDAIIIKVAGIGLTPKHLGKTLAQMQPALLKLNSMYGAHVCGEGGEYESLTLDSPLFKHRIVLRNREEVETVIHSESMFAPVAFLKVNRAKLQRKPSSSIPGIIVHIPQLFSRSDEFAREAISSTLQTASEESPPIAPKLYHYWDSGLKPFLNKRNGSWIVVSQVEVAYRPAQLSIEDEIRACFKNVQDCLAMYSLELSDIANINIFISTMELFSAINAVYASFFGTSPPARACVAVDLPNTSRVRLECIAFASQPYERLSLHVQSLSYWAPANIGPYSQAITVGERVFVSGQIGLVPFNNKLPVPQSLAQETALSLRHVRMITDAIKPPSMASWDGVTQGVITWLVNPGDISLVKCGMLASGEFHPSLTPMLFAVVKSLPKNALIEIQASLHTTLKAASDEDGYESIKMEPKVCSGQLLGTEAQWQAAYFDNMDAGFAIVSCMNQDDETLIAEKLVSLTELERIWRNTFSIRLFHTPNAAPNLQQLLRKLLGSDEVNTPVTAIPSRALATWARDDWDYAICFVG